jgi:histone deacetylase 11
MLPLIYSAQYNITAFGLEKLHKFDSVKYGRIHDWLIGQGVRKEYDFIAPEPCTREDLLRVHTADYLHRLGDRHELAGILEMGIVNFLPASFTDWRVLAPMRRAVGGTVLACQLARQHGVAINISGGYHHACPDHGRGFCVYADAPVALARLHAERPFRSALIVDTDAHQGDGTAESIRRWPWAHLLDFFEDALFPHPKVAESAPVPLASNLCGEEYLRILQTRLSETLDRLAPEMIVYNAGSDVLATDTIASMRLSVNQMVERDLHVLTEAHTRGIPIAMVLSGGYGPQSWEAHARSIKAAAVRFDAGTTGTRHRQETGFSRGPLTRRIR